MDQRVAIETRTSPDDHQLSFLIGRLSSIFQDKISYKRLLKCQKPEAQKLLDSFQWILDAAELDKRFRKDLIVAAQRIASSSNLYPLCYELESVEVEDNWQEPITGGTFAEIHKGKVQNQLVCLKKVRLYKKSRIEYLLKAFSKEAILWGQLSHPNILAIYGLFRKPEKICFVSLWMSNGNINDYLENNSEAPRQKLALDVAIGLRYLHSEDIVHGDLKGVNVLVDDAGRACLADFGMSSVSDHNILAWTSASAPASKGGTKGWQAPELFAEDKAAKNTMASDMYAWGCVCVELPHRIMGADGSGKSTFINLCYSEQVASVGTRNSASKHIHTYHLPYCDFPNNRIVLADMPGFDDFKPSQQSEIYQSLNSWLAKSAKIAGIVFCHDITQKKWQGSTKKAFQIFEDICGLEAAKKVVLLTTMWDTVKDQSSLVDREEELKNSYWKSMVSQGSVVWRLTNSETAHDIIAFLLNRDAFDIPLQIQQKLVDMVKQQPLTEVY